MQLDILERQRIKLYKEHLKKQIEKHGHIRKQENDYKRRRGADQNQLVNRLENNDLFRLENRRNNEILAKELNSELSELKKSNLHSEGNIGENNEKRQVSFTDEIMNQENLRLTRLRSEYKNQVHENQMNEHIRRNNQGKAKSVQKQEEMQHLRRLQQIEIERLKNYDEIKRKHNQDMRMYQLHSQLMNENEEYRRYAEKFTQCDQDILSHLHRNEASERSKNNRYNQQVLKNQMEEFNERRSLEKSQILTGHNIEESIFKNLLLSSPKNTKAYAEQLKSQMSEMEYRKSQEKRGMKEKYQIQGIFGGQQGPDRLNQIQYIDKKLGIRSPVINKINFLSNQAENQEATPNRVVHRPVEDTYVAKNQAPTIKKVASSLAENPEVDRRSLSPRFERIRQQVQMAQRQREKERERQIEISKQIQRQNQAPSPYFLSKNGSQPDSKNKKLYRSFDLVAGKSKYYGAS